MKLIADLETDGLLLEVSKIWCIGAIDIDTGDEYLFNSDDNTIDEGVAFLDKAEALVWHNERYDLEVIKKLYKLDWYDKSFCTLLMSKIHSPFLTGIKGVTNAPYSLKAFGHRFKFPKGDYTDWSHYTPEMGLYCLQDCRVTLKIWQWLENKGYDFYSDWNKIEHQFARVQQKAVNKGVWFDRELQLKTISEIDTRMNEIRSVTSDVLGYSFTNFDYTLLAEEVYKNKVVKGEKVKVLDRVRSRAERVSTHAVKKFNQRMLEFPSFDLPIQYSKTKCRVRYPEKITLDTTNALKGRLMELGWKPEFYTDPSKTHPDGQPQLVRDGEVDPNLVAMGDEYKEFVEYFMLKHRHSLIKGFTNLIRSDGRVAADADTVGTVTGRAGHRGVANFPRVTTPYGLEVRAMFGVKPNTNRKQMGSDLAGIEARLLAHYMNDNDFTEVVLNGDIHTTNQLAAGLPTRDDAKTFFYAFMYGAGDAKIGSIINGTSGDGKRIKAEFLSNLPSLADIIEVKQEEAKKGFITVLGGRPVKITKESADEDQPKWKKASGYDTRKALNSLLQGSGAIYFKKWCVEVDKLLTKDDTIVILYHDEVQIDFASEREEYNRGALQQALETTDKYFDVNCPNAIETKCGVTWRDCH